MRHEFLDLLACPACGAHLSVSADAGGSELVCVGCASRFATVDGMPLLLPESAALPDTTARAFSAQWRLREAGYYEQETLYGETAEREVASFLSRFSIGSPTDLNGKTILDAGCGCGRLTNNLAHLAPDVLVVGGDRSDAAWIAHRQCQGAGNVLVVQMDLLRAPFRPGSFDYVYADGLLPAVPDLSIALRSADRLVRPGGRLFVWVYPRVFNPYRALRNLLVKPYRLPLRVLRAVEWTAGIPFWLAFKMCELLLGARRRSLGEVLFNLHDNLAPEHQHRRRPDEIEAAFAALGYVDVQAIGPPTGVVGTKPARPAE